MFDGSSLVIGPDGEVIAQAKSFEEDLVFADLDALTGGDRYIDSASLTILQRAVLPNGDPSSKCLMNSTNFPGKQLLKNGGGSGAR